MFTQKKDYVYVYKGVQKLSKAGLRKLTVMGRKVKVEFLLQDLPAIGGKGSCRLCYLLGGQEKEKSWDIVFVSGGRQMHFLQKLEEAEEIEGIVDCRIFLPGGKEIHGEADAVTKEKQNVEAADARMQIPDIDKECQMKKSESKSEERQIKKPESDSEVAPGDEERSQEAQNKSRVETISASGKRSRQK